MFAIMNKNHNINNYNLNTDLIFGSHISERALTVYIWSDGKRLTLGNKNKKCARIWTPQSIHMLSTNEYITC